jgi:hypothetical protein
MILDSNLNAIELEQDHNSEANCYGYDLSNECFEVIDIPSYETTTYFGIKLQVAADCKSSLQVVAKKRKLKQYTQSQKLLLVCQ